MRGPNKKKKKKKRDCAIDLNSAYVNSSVYCKTTQIEQAYCILDMEKMIVGMI
jgi:hypothetical protein